MKDVLGRGNFYCDTHADRVPQHECGQCHNFTSNPSTMRTHRTKHAQLTNPAHRRALHGGRAKAARHLWHSHNVL